MGALLISLLTLGLLLISVFVILIVLMQRTSQSGGMGAALGGGAAQSAFGSETHNILAKGTIYGIIAFFVVALGLYLIYQAQDGSAIQTPDASTLITAGEAEPVADAGTAAKDAGAIVDATEGTIGAAGESVEGQVQASSTQAEEAVDAVVDVPEEVPASN